MVTFYIMLYQMGVYNRTYSFAPRPPEKYLTSARSNFKFPWKNRFRMGVIKVRLYSPLSNYQTGPFPIPLILVKYVRSLKHPHVTDRNTP